MKNLSVLLRRVQRILIGRGDLAGIAVVILAAIAHRVVVAILRVELGGGVSPHKNSNGVVDNESCQFILFN